MAPQVPELTGFPEPRIPMPAPTDWDTLTRLAPVGLPPGAELHPVTAVASSTATASAVAQTQTQTHSIRGMEIAYVVTALLAVCAVTTGAYYIIKWILTGKTKQDKTNDTSVNDKEYCDLDVEKRHYILEWVVSTVPSLPSPAMIRSTITSVQPLARFGHNVTSPISIRSIRQYVPNTGMSFDVESMSRILSLVTPTRTSIFSSPASSRGPVANPGNASPVSTPTKVNGRPGRVLVEDLQDDGSIKSTLMVESESFDVSGFSGNSSINNSVVNSVSNGDGLTEVQLEVAPKGFEICPGSTPELRTTKRNNTRKLTITNDVTFFDNVAPATSTIAVHSVDNGKCRDVSELFKVEGKVEEGIDGQLPSNLHKSKTSISSITETVAVLPVLIVSNNDSALNYTPRKAPIENISGDPRVQIEHQVKVGSVLEPATPEQKVKSKGVEKVWWNRKSLEPQSPQVTSTDGLSAAAAIAHYYRQSNKNTAETPKIVRTNTVKPNEYVDIDIEAQAPNKSRTGLLRSVFTRRSGSNSPSGPISSFGTPISNRDMRVSSSMQSFKRVAEKGRKVVRNLRGKGRKEKFANDENV